MSESMKSDLKDPRVPNYMYWTIEDVSKWIEELGFPDYKPCFENNRITGRKLIRLEASALPKLGIYEFEHIKKICSSIREMLTLEDPDWNRSISFPPRDDIGMYLEKKSVSGEHADELSYHTYLRDFQGVKWRPPLSNHCLILPHDTGADNDESFSYY